MNRSEDAIAKVEDAVSKVLTALKNAEPPPGMEDRILKALAQTEAVRSGRQPPRPIPMPARIWSFPPQLAYSLAATALIAIALGVWLAPRQAATRHPAPEVSSQTSVPAAFPPVAGPKHQAAARIPSTRRPHTAHPLRPALTPVSPAEAQPAPESFPAPEAPLTAQEKLLLRILHQGDAEELAALNPTLRAARDAEDAAEFDEFFKPRTTGAPDEIALP